MGAPKDSFAKEKSSLISIHSFSSSFGQALCREGGASINTHHCYFRTKGRAKRSGEGRGSSIWGVGGGFLHLLVVNAITEVHRMKELEGGPSNWMK